MAQQIVPDQNHLGNYQIGREIGQGSFAHVYLGTTTATPQRTVAIKSVRRERLTKKLLDNLDSEISILRSIRHQHIVALNDIVRTETHIHLIMEYCPLGDLAFFIKRRDRLVQEGQIPLLQEIAQRYPNVPRAGLHETLVRHFLQQLACALKFLQSKNLMHRDVKPQNLLLQPPDGYNKQDFVGLPNLPTLKLADFGFARHLQSQSMAETLCGSPLYMAPEILRYEKYDSSADLWSTGTVLYEMLVGKPPFRAPNHIDLLRKIDKSNDVIKFPADVLLDEDIRSLIRALLKRNPSDRIRFEDFFNHPVVTTLLPVDNISEPSPATVLANSMMVRPARVSSPISVEGTVGVPSERIVGSPAFVTDLITPTPPTQSRMSILARPEQPSNPSYRRRETMPLNRSRPQISPSYRSPVPMDRRPSHRAETRPTMTPREGSYERAQDILEYEREHLRSRQSQRADSATSSRSREKERQDSEGEYVVVSKTQVEVNTVADAVARSPHHNTRRLSLLHRASQGSIGSATSQAMNRATVQTLAAAERRLGSSPTGAIAKALSMASQRLFGGGSPPAWLEQLVSTNRTAIPGRALVRTDLFGWSNSGSEESLSIEERRLIDIIELVTIKANVVYDFGELKLRQLVPPPPSQASDEGECVLTNEATVALCEEALALYLKTLSLLQKNIDSVQKWLQHENFTGAGQKLNSIVQWTRDRYNEVLEKAEYLQQKKLTTLSLVPPDYAFDEVTAEKLLYDRALEISRGAAVNEIVGDDISQCEGEYEVSIIMLEAILEGPANNSPTSTTDSIEADDRRAIEKWVQLTRTRLDKFRIKLDNASSRVAMNQLQIAE